MAGALGATSMSRYVLCCLVHGESPGRNCGSWWSSGGGPSAPADRDQEDAEQDGDECRCDEPPDVGAGEGEDASWAKRWLVREGKLDVGLDRGVGAAGGGVDVVPVRCGPGAERDVRHA